MKKEHIKLIIFVFFTMFFIFSFNYVFSTTTCKEGLLNEFICDDAFSCQKYLNSDCTIAVHNCNFCENGCSNGRCLGLPTTTIPTTPTTSVNWCGYLCAFNCNQNNNPPNCYNAIEHPDQVCVISSMKCCEYVPKQCPVTTSTPTTTTPTTSTSTECPYECWYNYPGDSNTPPNCWSWIEHPETPCRVTIATCYSKVTRACPTTSTPTTSVNWCGYLCAFNCNQNNNPPNCYNAIEHPDQVCVISSMKCCEFISKPCPITTTIPTTSIKYCEGQNHGCFLSCQDDNYPPDCYSYIEHPETPCAISPLKCCEILAKPCPVTTSIPTTSIPTTIPIEICKEGYLNEFTCDDAFSCQKYLNNDCTIAIRNCNFCDHGCSNGICLGESATILSTTLPDCPYQCLDTCDLVDNEPPDCWIKISHPKYYCPNGVCCEVKSKECPECTADSQCNDDEVCSNEKCIKAKLVIAFVPINWDENIGNFNDEVDKQADFLTKNLPLVGCKELVRSIKIQENYKFEPACGCDDLQEIKNFADRWTTSYDYVVGLDKNSVNCGRIQGFGCNIGTVYVKKGKTEVTAHELGHEWGLRDEYCDYNTLCGVNATPNYLSPELGCDVQGGCCWCHNVYDVCCYGNKNPYGGRSIMSYAGAPGPRAHDILSMEHLKKNPQLVC